MVNFCSEQTNCNVISFDLRSSNRDEVLEKADLFLAVNLTNSRAQLGVQRLVKLYQLLDDGEQLISSDVIQTSSRLDYLAGFSQSQVWHRLRVTQAVTTWIQTPSSNRGLRLQVETEHDGRVLPCDQSSFILQEHSLQPVLVAFSRDLPHPTADHKKPQRLRRSLQGYTKPPVNPTCHLRELSVNLTQFKGGLLSPQIADISYCTGRCRHPIPHPITKTGHAILQSIAHYTKENVPETCCMPTKFRPVDFVYYDALGTFVIRKVFDVIVQSCGCR